MEVTEFGPVELEPDGIGGNASSTFRYCVEAREHRNWTFQSHGTYGATVNVEITLDDPPTAGGNWSSIGTLSTSGQHITFTKPFVGVRFTVTNFANGTVYVRAMATP